MDILKFAKDEQIDVLTFGGGDPFQYSMFRKVLQKARGFGFLVHVDTHGVGLRPSDYQLIQDGIDLVGLPIDGQRAVHDFMRKRPGHFEVAMQILQKLLHQGTRVKINSVVSRLNTDSLILLAEDIVNNPPTIWSLYQFMELPEKHEINQAHKISDGDFLSFASGLKDKVPLIAFEVGETDHRKTGYLFVQTDGTLFTHSPTGVGYRNLGTIYTSEWKERFFELNDNMLPKLSVNRYSQESEVGRSFLRQSKQPLSEPL